MRLPDPAGSDFLVGGVNGPQYDPLTLHLFFVPTPCCFPHDIVHGIMADTIDSANSSSSPDHFAALLFPPVLPFPKLLRRANLRPPNHPASSPPRLLYERRKDSSAVGWAVAFVLLLWTPTNQTVVAGLAKVCPQFFQNGSQPPDHHRERPRTFAAAMAFGHVEPERVDTDVPVVAEFVIQLVVDGKLALRPGGTTQRLAAAGRSFAHHAAPYVLTSVVAFPEWRNSSSLNDVLILAAVAVEPSLHRRSLRKTPQRLLSGSTTFLSRSPTQGSVSGKHSS